MFEINGYTKQLAIFGDPIEHTMSPQMHNFLSEKYNNNYVYSAYRVTPDNLKDAIFAIRALGIKGVNITAPHKFKVIPYLDEISPLAQKFGSVNTVVNNNGHLTGYSTDAEGFYLSLLAEGITVKDKDILFIGAGGATQPIICLFALKGARSITIKNRTLENAIKLADYVERVCNYKVNTEEKLSHYDLVINTTSVGIYPDINACPIDDFSFIDETTAAADLIYNPEKTLFLQRAEEKGAKIVNGLGMLIYQGLLAYELFTDTKLPEDCYELVKKEVFGK